tara:strand:- start:717 stop:1025 length:309 start_codon:yes stop_codon:yes gene_type:complete
MRITKIGIKKKKDFRLMSDPLIREIDNYVVLVPGESEQFLDRKETLVWLQSWLNKFDSLPLDLACKPSIAEAAQHLLDTACDLEIKTGFKVQWYAVRLEPQD